jgi:hypothetical protein
VGYRTGTNLDHNVKDVVDQATIWGGDKQNERNLLLFHGIYSQQHIILSLYNILNVKNFNYNLYI